MSSVKSKIIFGVLLMAFIFTASSCSKSIKRIEVDKQVDLSGRWNDTDSRLVSEEMIRDCLARSWVDDFAKKNGKSPDVIVGKVVNKSFEHINTETFTKDLERALLNSGKVTFVANKGEREGVRDERDDMSRNATPQSRKAAGMEAGADFMIIGQINAINDEESKKVIAYYQIELEAVDMNNNRKVWMGQKKIKKYIKRHNADF